MHRARPRVFCIPSTASPIVAVLRRGPSDWFHVGRWDVRAWTYEPGAWFRGRLFPQKCDLSPDGRWLAYSAHKPTAGWEGGTIYEGISRLPWLHALVAWEAGTTYTRGLHFDETDRTSDAGAPDVGDAAPCLRRYGLRITRAAQFAVERRRGWTESADTPPRDTRDAWDEKRTVRMCRTQPSGSAILEVEGSYAAFRDSPDLREPAHYVVRMPGRCEPLDDVQWADWSARGELLSATVDGRLRAVEWRDGAGRELFEQDLARLEPDPQPPPAWAHEW